MAEKEDKALRGWVADQLHDLLGFSESHVASFVLATARKHTSADSLSTALRQQGLPATQATSAFASQLLQRLPRAGGAQRGPAGQQHLQQAKQARDLQRKNQSYGLLEGDDEPPAPAPAPAASMPPPPSRAQHGEDKGGSAAPKGKERQLRTKREASREEEEEEGAHAAVLHGKRSKRAWEEDEEDEAEREERRAQEERDRDKREKEEFEARLRNRDDSKTKKLAGEKLTREERREQEKRK
jgi:pre-mRNA-splicing factor ATP-dependent RNA helicase DHX16